MHHLTINQIKQKERKTKKKVTFHQENCVPKSASKRARSKIIPKCLQKNRKQKNSPSNSKNNRKQNYPHHRLIPSITSRLVGSTEPMSPPAKKVLLWIGSPRAMAAANTKTRSGASAYRLELAVNRSYRSVTSLVDLVGQCFLPDGRPTSLVGLVSQRFHLRVGPALLVGLVRQRFLPRSGRLSSLVHH
jgi:hypothetical protein